MLEIIWYRRILMVYYCIVRAVMLVEIFLSEISISKSVERSKHLKHQSICTALCNFDVITTCEFEL